MEQVVDERIAIRISRSQKKQLQEEAREEGRTLSNLIIRKLTTSGTPSGTNRPDRRK